MLIFIKSILPSDNLIITSYNKLIRGLDFKRPLKQKICSECNESVDINNKCQNEFCTLQETMDIIKFDFNDELRLVLSNNWLKILDYKIKPNTKKFSDVCNSSNNSLIKNSISLILFADGAVF